MSVWQLNESRGLGGNDRVWRLSREGDGLTIGRAAYCNVQVLSQAVEKKHSIIKWDERKENFVIHDLGSSSVTFLNDLPLSNGVATLHNGDVLRFGYDKGHLFHVRRVEQPSTPPPSSSTQLGQPSPPPPPPPTFPLLPSSSLPISYQDHRQTAPLQVSGGVQYVSIASHSPSVILPAGQHLLLPQPIYAATHVPHIGHMAGHVTTSSSPLVTGYLGQYGSVIPASPVPSTPLHLLPSYPLTPTPLPPSTSSFSPSPSSTQQPYATQISPAVQTKQSLHDTEIMRRRSTSHEVPTGANSGGGGTSSGPHRPPPPPPRKDGRRSVPLSSSNTPRLAEVSSLYGRPSWWVGDSDAGDSAAIKAKDESPPKPVKRSEPQILRSISPPPQSPTKTSTMNTRGRQGVGGGSSDEQEKQTSSAWTVGTGLRRSKTIPSKWKRNTRSADSSPIRSPVTPGGARTVKKRSVSPSDTPLRSSKTTTAPSSKVRSSTPLSQRRTASNPPGSSSGPRPIRRPGSISPSRHIPRTSSPKPPRDRQQQQKQKDKKSRSKLGIVTVEGKEGGDRAENAPASSPPPPPPPPGEPGRGIVQVTADVSPSDHEKKVSSEEQSVRDQSEPSLATGLVEEEKKVSDETYVVKSPTEEQEERTGSARKTWSSQSQQGSLMMASIEARMKRLDSMAQNTYHSLSSLQQGSKLAGPVCESPLLGPGEGSEVDSHHIPEWKFFNKEVDGIFKSIRSVEKWLKDMGETVERLRQTEIAGKEPGNETGKNSIDLPLDSESQSESDGTGFQDSIEDDCRANSN